MPADFDDTWDKVADDLLDTFGESGSHVTSGGTTTSLTIACVPQVGALDDTDRLIVYAKASALPAAGPLRNDYFLRESSTQRWSVVDVKNRNGWYRVLCLAPIERS